MSIRVSVNLMTHEKLAASLALVRSTIVDVRLQIARAPEGGALDRVRARLAECEAAIAIWSDVPPRDEERLAVLSAVLGLMQEAMELAGGGVEAAPTERVLPPLDEMS